MRECVNSCRDEAPMAHCRLCITGRLYN